MNRRDATLAATVAVLWGFNFVVIDWGMRQIPPLLFASIRFFLVGLPAVLGLIPRPQVHWWKIAAVGAFMSLGQFGLLYTSLNAGMPAGLASLVLQVQVAATIVIAAVVLHERPTGLQISGVGMGLAGLVVVAVGTGGHVAFGALALCLGAALSWAIGNVISRAVKVPGGLSLTVWSALVVPCPLLLLALLVNGPHALQTGIDHFGWKAALSTAYTVVVASFFGYGTWNSLLSRHQPSSVVPWVLLVPPAGIVSAWVCFGQPPGATELAGGGVLILGVLVATSRSRTQAPRLRHLRPTQDAGQP